MYQLSSKHIYTPKPLYLDLPVKFSKSLLIFGVVRSISTPLTFNNSFNFKSVTTVTTVTK
jgi:hypothetical protein